MALARSMAIAALEGVGDPALGEWHEQATAYHIRRRLSDAERALAGSLTVRDIRGTQEERRRFELLFAEVPYLKAALQSHGLYNGQ